MTQATRTKLLRYLTPEQLTVHEQEQMHFLEYVKAKHDGRADDVEAHRIALHEASSRFLKLTDGKVLCQLVPLSVW